MDEEDCDYRTPIGKVIKQINYLCKKPPFDNQLSEAIDVFHEKLSEQDKYLVNGIFRINFAESALFLQSCAELYGKKIDLLWNELLEFHTRLIKYDCEHQKEKGIPINKEAVEKLEERRNRYLRKKNFRLLQEEEGRKEENVHVVNPAKIALINEINYLVFEDGKLGEKGNKVSNPTGHCKSVQMWNDIEVETKERLKVPFMVYQQSIRTYRLRNYPILQSEDFDILDLEDGEFNTKYSRVPGWHHMLHLIEYNDEGLLPDNNNLIANLKLSIYGKIKFLLLHKLPIDTPFETYKNEYKEYKIQFYKEEAKRWQNMPLNTFEDFRKQLELLTHMYGKSDRCTVKSAGGNNGNDKIEIISSSSDEDSLMELASSCDKECNKSDLFVRVEKLSGDIINTKLRQDSGFYDYNSGSEGESENVGVEGTVNTPDEVSPQNADNDVTKTDTEKSDTGVNSTSDNNVDNNPPNDDNSSPNVDNSSPNADNTLTNVENNSLNVDNSSPNVDNNSPNVDNSSPNVDNGSTNIDVTMAVNAADDDNFDTRSFVSDHDYCLAPPAAVVSANRSVDGTNNKEVHEKTTETIMKKPLMPPPKVIKSKETRKKHQISEEDEDEKCLPKRRKLTQRQIQVLLRSIISPVELLRFEKFFSENYQSEEGEGQVPTVEYDPAMEIVESDHGIAENKICTDLDDTRSIFSEHSYCQPQPTDSRNDSGFIEPLTLPSQESEEDGAETDNPFTFQEGVPFDEELERLSALLQQDTAQAAASKKQPPRLSPEEQEREDSRARVEEWRNTINPILKNLREHDFDIHEYGSRIIDGMEIDETKPFGSIVDGMKSAEVVRYFISSLQLANTNNIEICGAKQGELSNDSYNVKLLSKDRFHEHLKDYLAPSEETLAEKMDRVRAMNVQQDNFGPTKAKQLKLSDKPYKGKAFHGNGKSTPTKSSSNADFSQRATAEVTNDTYQHNKENRSASTPPRYTNPAKGKSIVKRQANTPHVLNYDMAVASTSRSSNFDDQVPSTSSQGLLPAWFEEDRGRSPRTYEVSPNKRRRSESSEESFLDRLVASQRTNPDIQVHSTPHGPSPSKHMKTSSGLKKSILF